ncbi:MAG: hypothetical protein BWX95_02521 [Bacteroidetes bacterium ADurb.Bin141]|nr:MAG: hypothetical protein BWX95_02521 [Bacteroidetes bacterium ADurb.Bin141]
MDMGKKFIIILTFSVIVMILANSGCIDNTQANSTWGERQILVDAIKISDNTTGNYSENNQSRYYVYGYLDNDNPFEAINPKIKITTYYENGTVFAVNETAYIYPKNIPGKGSSYFFARFHDPDKLIYNFTVEVLDAKGEYWS